MSPVSAPAGEAPERPSAASGLAQEEIALLKRELAGAFQAQVPLAEAFLGAEPQAGQEAMFTGAARFVLERSREIAACLRECIDALGAGAPKTEAGLPEEAPAAPLPDEPVQAVAAAGSDEAAGADGSAEGGSDSPEETAPADAGTAPEDSRSEACGQNGPEPAGWREACQAILDGRYDGDRDRLLALLEQAMAKADEEQAGPEDRKLVEAASDHFTSLLARGATGQSKDGPAGREAEPKKAPESGAATFTVTPAGTCASGGVDIPVVHAGSGAGAPEAAEEETPFEELPSCIQELVRLAEGRFDTGDAQADVRSLSQRFRRLREDALAEGGASRWEAYFKRASAHIAKLLNQVHGEGGFAREEGAAQDAGSPRYMREVDAVARGDYDGRVDDIYAILSNAILEARRDGREEEFQPRLEAASEHLNSLLSSRCVHAGRGQPQAPAEDPAAKETAEELEQEIFRGETPDEDFVDEAGQRAGSAGAGAQADSSGVQAEAGKTAPDEAGLREQEAGTPRPERSGEPAAFGEAREPEETPERSRHARPLGLHRQRQRPSWQACVQAVKDIGHGRFDADPKGALELLREAAARLEQEGLAEHFEPEIRRAARRLALLMRQEPEAAAGGPRAMDPRFASRPDPRFAARRPLPSYMQGVEDINQGRFDDDPGTMLEILDYAIRAASSQGRLEEFRPRLEQASRRASAVLERRSGGLFGGRLF